MRECVSLPCGTRAAPDSPAWWARMFAAPLPISGAPAMEELKRRLWEEHQIEAPITPWRDQSFIRVSIQAYNSPGDVDRLLEGLQRLLP